MSVCMWSYSDEPYSICFVMKTHYFKMPDRFLEIYSSHEEVCVCVCLCVCVFIYSVTRTEEAKCKETK